MGSLQIVASKEEYKIFDNDEDQIIVTGISSYKNAINIYEKLIGLKESVARYSSNPCAGRPG